jgi:cysteine desulfurase/selenocysteine lyase
VRSAFPYHLDEYPYRMEYGTPNILGIASLWAAQEWLAESGGIEKIHDHEMQLTGRLVEGLKGIEGVTIYCCENLDNHLPTVTINIEGMEAGDVGIMLDVEYNIATRTGLHCAPLVHNQLGTTTRHGGVRIAIGPFNTVEHIDAAIDAVSQISRHIMKKRPLQSS